MIASPSGCVNQRAGDGPATWGIYVRRQMTPGERRGVTTAWHEIEAWRRAKRRELLALRQAVAPARADEIRDAVARLVAYGVPGLTSACVGFYWPFRGELDLRPLAADLVARGARAALPAVVVKGQPVAFRPWTPGMAL